MNKLAFRDAFKNTTMFLVDENIEDHYENYINSQVTKLKVSLSNIHTSDGLESYIRTDSSSIENLLTILGVSGEKFRRVVSWIRLNSGYTFESEWSPSKLRTELTLNQELMRYYCELFTSGSTSDKFTTIIPRFILTDFRIDKDVVARLLNDDYLRNLIKDKVTTEYNARYCDLYYLNLFTKIDKICKHSGVVFEKNFELPGFRNKKYNVVKLLNKYIIINAHFYLTTSSNQTKYYNEVVKPSFENARTNVDVIVLNILDGAGWIGRSADFKKIYYDCDHFLNLKTLHHLEDIIKKHFNID